VELQQNPNTNRIRRAKLCSFNHPTDDLRDCPEWRPEQLRSSFVNNVYIRSHNFKPRPYQQVMVTGPKSPSKRSWRILLSNCKSHLRSCLQRALSRSWNDSGKGPGIRQLSLVVIHGGQDQATKLSFVALPFKVVTIDEATIRMITYNSVTLPQLARLWNIKIIRLCALTVQTMAVSETQGRNK